MSFGGIFGGALIKVVPYVWIFNINAFILCVLFVAVMIVYPYDAPIKGLADSTNQSGGGGTITMFTLVKRFNQFSVACVICSVLFTYC